MEEEILLDMYRSSWDDFLDSYKNKMNENEALIKLLGEVFEKHKTAEKGFSAKLGEIIKEYHGQSI
jgi:hypothetical protein